MCPRYSNQGKGSVSSPLIDVKQATASGRVPGLSRGEVNTSASSGESGRVPTLRWHDCGSSEATLSSTAVAMAASPRNQLR
jgi:hypothetical protein